MRKTISALLAACLAAQIPAQALAAAVETRTPAGVPILGPVLPGLQATLPVLPALPATAGPALSPALPNLAAPGLKPEAPSAPLAGLAAAQAVIDKAPDLQAASPEQSRNFAAAILGEKPAAPALALPEAPEAGGGSGQSLGPPSSRGGPPSGPPQSPKRRAATRPFLFSHPWIARVILTPIAKLAYRTRVAGRENIPAGPMVLISNHASWVDWLFVFYATGRPMRFMMSKTIYQTRGLTWLFKAAGAIPVKSGDAENTKVAIEEARAALRDGQSVVILPEGAITHNGNMKGFRAGFGRIAEGLGVPVIPTHLDGLWGSIWSRKKGVSLLSNLRSGRRLVSVRYGKPLADLEPQTAREAVEDLGVENFAARIQDTSKALPVSFLETAKRFWRKPAVLDSTGQNLTYGRTLAAAILLAGLLKPHVTYGPNVGILLPPTAGGVLTNIALGTLGKVTVNLNYTASAEAQSHAVETAGLGVVVTSRKFEQVLIEKKAALPPAPRLYLEDLLPLIPGWKKALTFIALTVLPAFLIKRIWMRQAGGPLQRATILFTSGSSALPKGVLLTHGNIQANVEMVRSAFPMTVKDRVLGVLPFFHSFGYTASMWLPLLTGLSAAYHVHPLETDAIAKLSSGFKPTILLGTPTFLQRYIERIPKEAMSTLRFVVAGAEKLRGSIADDFARKFGTRPYEAYGATELSPAESVNIPDLPKQKGNKDGSVGQALPGSAARVVDPVTFKPLPYGTQGLLLVKGAHVMQGYLYDAEKTKQVLKDGWYVTGDLAVIDREGFITLAGRQSRFSKIAGEMVSHVAVEEKLQQAAGITEQVFVVAGVPDERRGEKLVVLHAGYQGSIEELVAKAQALGLPGLWTPLPSSFYRIDAIPVLGTGKLDLKAVQELALKLAGNKTAPR